MLVIVIPRDEEEIKDAYTFQERILHDPRYPWTMTVQLLDQGVPPNPYALAEQKEKELYQEIDRLRQELTRAKEARPAE